MEGGKSSANPNNDRTMALLFGEAGAEARHSEGTPNIGQI